MLKGEFNLYKRKGDGSVLMVLSKNPDGTLNTTFQLSKPKPNRIFKYHQFYLDQYYDHHGTLKWNTDN